MDYWRNEQCGKRKATAIIIIWVLPFFFFFFLFFFFILSIFQVSSVLANEFRKQTISFFPLAGFFLYVSYLSILNYLTSSCNFSKMIKLPYLVMYEYEIITIL